MTVKSSAKRSKSKSKSHGRRQQVLKVSKGLPYRLIVDGHPSEVKLTDVQRALRTDSHLKPDPNLQLTLVDFTIDPTLHYKATAGSLLPQAEVLIYYRYERAEQPKRAK